jgi:hypothetical protein
MKILLAPLLLAVSLPAFAEVDPKIHKLCIEAKDYAGCVRAMKGETSTETTVNQIQRQGANLTEGNMCPAQHLSSGGGYCQRVVCIKAGLWGRGHDEGLAGKGNACAGGAEMRWDNNHQPIRASFDKKCPGGNLDVGFSNTCYQALAYGFYEGYSFGFTTRKLNAPHTDINVTDKITKVYGSPAQNNLELGDKLISIDGMKLKDYKPDPNSPSTVNLVIERNGKRLVFILTSEFQKIEITKLKNL